MIDAAALLDACGDRLYATAFRLCGNATEAQDLLFRTFEQAVVKRKLFDSTREPYPWLRKILINFWQMDLRRKGANALDFPGELPELPVAAQDPGERLDGRIQADALATALGNLDEPFRELIVLRYDEDMSVPEIAEVVGIPEGTVKSRLHEAKRRLRAEVLRTIPDMCVSNDRG